MPKIFISYRRKDSAQMVGRIYERLEHEFGKSNVFYDIEAIAKGENFTEVLRQKVASCDILLAIMGPQWATIVDANGNKRLFDETDYVRYEVDTALRIPRIKVIPILINEAEMPPAADLPHVLQPITVLNAAKIRNDPDFQSDMDKLVTQLSPRRLPKVVWAALAVLLVVIGLIAFAPRLFPAAGATATATLTPSPVAPTATLTPTLNVPSTGTATQSIQLDITATEIMLQRTVDAKQTANAVLLAESTHLAETANAVPTSTPVPSNTPKPSVTPVPPSSTPVLPTLMPVTAAPANGQLHVFASRESLTLYVAQSVSLLSFQFGVIVDSKLKLNALADSFDVLTLSGGQADVNDCYIYQADGTAPPLSQSCKGRVFRTTLAAADVFWYDAVTNLPRNLAIFRDGQTTGIICSAAAPDCGVIWASVAPSIPTQVPTFTPVPATVTTSPTITLQTSPQAPSVWGYPCPAAIMESSATRLDRVRSRPSTTAPKAPSVIPGEAVLVLTAQPQGTQIMWYQIAKPDGASMGWIMKEYLVLSSSCPP